MHSLGGRISEPPCYWAPQTAAHCRSVRLSARDFSFSSRIYAVNALRQDLSYLPGRLPDGGIDKNITARYGYALQPRHQGSHTLHQRFGIMCQKDVGQLEAPWCVPIRISSYDGAHGRNFRSDSLIIGVSGELFTVTIWSASDPLQIALLQIQLLSYPSNRLSEPLAESFTMFCYYTVSSDFVTENIPLMIVTALSIHGH